MSAKGEKYKSKSAKMKHEKSESFKERVQEYGGVKAAKKKAAMKKATPVKKKK